VPHPSHIPIFTDNEADSALCVKGRPVFKLFYALQNR